MHIPRRFVALGLTTLLVACGGGQAEPKEPEGATVTEPSAAEEPKGEEADMGGDDKSGEKSAKDEAPKEEEAKKPTRTAKDLVTKQDVLFMFSLQASEPYQEAEKKCTESSKDDPKKKADCMSKATKKFEPDGMAFQQIDGKWWWLTVRRKGQGLVTLHKIEFEFGEDGEKQITIKPKGPDKGTKPMGNIPKELTIEVPSDSEIAIKDPKLGRLVYEAKMGLLGEQAR